MAQFFWTGEPPLMRVEEYDGRADLEITPTQLASNGLVTAAEQRRILRDWIAFLADAPLPIRRLSFFSRVPQELLDAVAGQLDLGGLPARAHLAQRGEERVGGVAKEFRVTISLSAARPFSSMTLRACES